MKPTLLILALSMFASSALAKRCVVYQNPGICHGEILDIDKNFDGITCKELNQKNSNAQSRSECPDLTKYSLWDDGWL